MIWMRLAVWRVMGQMYVDWLPAKNDDAEYPPIDTRLAANIPLKRLWVK